MCASQVVLVVKNPPANAGDAGETGSIPGLGIFLGGGNDNPLQYPRLCPWDSPGKNTGVGFHALLQGIFLTQGSNLSLLTSLALASGFFTTNATWEALLISLEQKGKRISSLTLAPVFLTFKKL